jgi:hypothetical protein
LWSLLKIAIQGNDNWLDSIILLQGFCYILAHSCFTTTWKSRHTYYWILCVRLIHHLLCDFDRSIFVTFIFNHKFGEILS